MMAPRDQAEAPPKKPRYEKSIPYVPIHSAIPASRSSAILHTGYPVRKLKLEEAAEDLFFPDTANVEPDSIEIGDLVKQALLMPQDEETLRNSVYTELKLKHGIDFPLSSEQPAGESPRNEQPESSEDSTLRYQERNLADVLHELGRQGDGDGNDTQTARLLHGLNVTTTSLPDMTVLKEGYLYFGEFKNSDKYKSGCAAKQCTLYLYALMYFLRVRLGRPVKAVFGFLVCGAGCFVGTDYAVGYVRLSAPEQLGGCLVPQVFTKFHNINSVRGIQELVCFLKSGKIVELDEGRAPVDVDRRTPALLSLPTSLWASPLLVPNGSASMVFKGNGNDILGLLPQLPEQLEPHIESFLSSAQSLLKEAMGKARETTFFLKIRLEETTLRRDPALTATTLLDEKNDFFRKLYPIDPFGNSHLGLLLMNNWGEIVHKSEAFKNLGFAGFRACFANLRKDLMALSNVVLHGDALPHNMVYDESIGKLGLIDFDEGMVDKDDAHERVVKEGEDLTYLLYPNFLRKWVNRSLYTEVQLAASFLLLAPWFEQTLEADRTLVTDLLEAAETANSFLKETNGDDPAIARGSEIDPSVSRLTKLLEETLEPQAKSILKNEM